MAQDKVVYHFDNSDAQATAGLRTLRNYMDTAPTTRIVVGALGDGVHFLKEAAKDKKNPDIEYGPLISDLVAKGVKFGICELTLRALDPKKEPFVLDASFTPNNAERHFKYAACACPTFCNSPAAHLRSNGESPERWTISD